MRIAYSFKLTALFLALVTPLSLTAHAGGDTYKRVVCAEADYDDVKKKKCQFKFKLKKLQTKEFRGHCEYVRNEKTVVEKPRNQKCQKNNSANSCTGTIDGEGGGFGLGYMSCSCTNWDITTSHNVKVLINC